MKFKKLHFGPSGIGDPNINIPYSSKNPTADAILKISDLSLSALELAFVRQVYLKNAEKEKLEEIRKNAEKKEFALSIHAPYFVNLNSPEKQKVFNSHRYIIDSLNVGHEIGANIIVVHLGYYLKSGAEETRDTILEEINKILNKTKSSTYFGAETMGKKSQFGSLDELLYIYDRVDKKRFMPVIDFAHLHAREIGLFRDLKELDKVFDKLKSYPEILNRIHIHMSGIEYGDKGERKHLVFKKSDVPYRNILENLKEVDAKGTIISESPEIVKDCLMLKKEWEKLD